MNTLPQRKKIRLTNYDYSQNGYYFITICTHGKQPILGHYVNNAPYSAPNIILTKIGIEIKQVIDGLTKFYLNMRIHKYVIMPNHIHLIVVLQKTISDSLENLSLQSAKSIPSIVGGLKSYTNKIYNTINNSNDLTLWQKSYHDHIIRNEGRYLLIWNYIDTNPLKWHNDCFYCENMTQSSPNIETVVDHNKS